MTKDFIDHAQKAGREMTEAQARKEVNKIADSVESKRDHGVFK